MSSMDGVQVSQLFPNDPIISKISLPNVNIVIKVWHLNWQRTVSNIWQNFDVAWLLEASHKKQQTKIPKYNYEN